MELLSKVARRISRANSALNTAANIIAVVFIFLLMFLITADVTGRYGWNSPVHGTYEIGQSLIVFVVFFSLAYTQRLGGHIRVETLIRYLPRRPRLVVEIFFRMVTLFFFGCLTYMSWQVAWASWLEREWLPGIFYGGLHIPVYPSKFAVPLGSGLICLQFLVGLASRVTELRGPSGGGSP